MIIETRGLSKQYGGAAALSNLNLAVPAGRISAFLGPNGSGKSTTLRILLGQSKPTAGEAFVLGRSATDAAQSLDIRRRTAYIGEDKRLYGYMSVRQLLDSVRPLYTDWDPPREQALLERFELPPARLCRQLSKGMRTKLALVLAFSRSPELVILDEPSEGLDPVHTEQFLELVIRAAAEGASIFFSTHQIAEAERIADHIFVIHRGSLVLEGPLDELRAGYRRVQFAFPGPPPVKEMTLPSVLKIETQGHVLSLVANGGLDAITTRAHALGALSVDEHPFSLRELFLESIGEKPA